MKGLRLAASTVTTAGAALVEQGKGVGEIRDFTTVKQAAFRRPDGHVWLVAGLLPLQEQLVQAQC